MVDLVREISQGMKNYRYLRSSYSQQHIALMAVEEALKKITPGQTIYLGRSVLATPKARINNLSYKILRYVVNNKVDYFSAGNIEQRKLYQQKKEQVFSYFNNPIDSCQAFKPRKSRSVKSREEETLNVKPFESLSEGYSFTYEGNTVKLAQKQPTMGEIIKDSSLTLSEKRLRIMRLRHDKQRKVEERRSEREAQVLAMYSMQKSYASARR